MSASPSIGERELTRKDRHSGRRWHHDTRGVVYVEFLIAFLPVYIFFLALLQIGLLFTARLITEHAAITAARAAAVVIGDDNDKVYDYGSEAKHQLDPDNLDAKRTEAVYNATLIALMPLILNGVAQGVDVLYPAEPGGQAQSGTVTFKPLGVYDVDKVRVRVEVDAMCQIALVNRIVCDTPHIGGLSSLLILTRKVRAEAVYPYQGALYDQIKK